MPSAPIRSAKTISVATLSLAALLGATTGARVHPHVMAEARLDVVLDAAHSHVASLRHLWRFDDLFSSTVMLEFDKNADMKLDDTELAEIADVIHGSLAEFAYFQMVTADGKDVAMKPPPRLMANFQDNQLIVMFESEPEKPMPLAGKLDFGVYDPTFYTAIDFIEDDNMQVADLPAQCTRSVVRPDPDEAIAQNQDKLTDAFFNDPAGTDLSKIFATRLELDCKAEG